MHCSSCEILIEKKLLETKGIRSVEARADKGEITINYSGEKPSLSNLNKIFNKHGYIFYDHNKNTEIPDSKKNEWGLVVTVSGLLILIFLLLNYLGIGSLVSVNSQSSVFAFFVFGLLAGVSSCAALIGGIVLSMSKQWMEIYAEKNSTLEKLQPHLLFNLGRMVSFGLLGGVLGWLGEAMGISLVFTSFLVLAVSLLMVIIGLQMLGVKYFQKFSLTTPKFITRYVANEKNFQGRLMPFFMGALTFFLPCGFTITTQGLALLSGGPLAGALIMTAFVLGTTPALLGIGFSSLKLSQDTRLAGRFTRVAGILILFFALFNLNSQLNVLGSKSISDFISPKKVAVSAGKNGLPPVINGKQIIKMNASASGYLPNYFKVKAGIPVHWEITDTGTSGCTNAVISRSLFADQINLTPGQVSIKEFTPGRPGIYKFSCWMGMVSGTIEVVK